MEIPKLCDPNLRTLLMQLLEKDPKKRITLSDIKLNAWLTDNASVKLGTVTNIIKREDITDKEVRSAFTRRAILFVRIL